MACHMVRLSLSWVTSAKAFDRKKKGTKKNKKNLMPEPWKIILLDGFFTVPPPPLNSVYKLLPSFLPKFKKIGPSVLPKGRPAWLGVLSKRRRCQVMFYVLAISVPKLLPFKFLFTVIPYFFILFHMVTLDTPKILAASD